MGKQVSLNELANIVCDVTGVSMESFLEHQKRSTTGTARGVFLMLSRELGIHPRESSAFIDRSRSSCITTAKKYKGYYDTKDKEICCIVEKVRNMLRNE